MYGILIIIITDLVLYSNTGREMESMHYVLNPVTDFFIVHIEDAFLNHVFNTSLLNIKTIKNTKIVKHHRDTL